MQITVKFFASLRETMGYSERVVTVDQAEISVGALWQQHLSQQPLHPNTLIAINMEYHHSDDIVRAGDEVAFFPPVTGG